MTVSVQGAYPGRPAHRYLRPAAPLRFPVEERVPETWRHMEVRTALYLVVRDAFRDRATIGSEQFVYWDPTNPRACCAPDLFVKLGVPLEPFESWKAWERGAPDLVIEIVSASDTSETPWDQKLDRFRRLGAKEIVRFDPDDAEHPLRIWDGADGDVPERDPADSDFNRCDTLGMYFCVYRDPLLGLALGVARDPEGRDRLLTPPERETQAKRRIAELEAQLAKRGG
jgi:hypothetical protein